MAKYSIDSSTLTGIADAIRTQYGETDKIAVTDMAEAILGISGGGESLAVESGEMEFIEQTNVLSFEHETELNSYILLVMGHEKTTNMIGIALFVVSSGGVKSSLMDTFTATYYNNTSVSNSFVTTLSDNTISLDGTGKTTQRYFKGKYSWYIIPTPIYND